MDPYQIHLNWSDSDTSCSGQSELDEEYYKYKPPPIVISPEDIIVIEAVEKPHKNGTEFGKHFPKYSLAENVACKKIGNKPNHQRMKVAGRTNSINGTNKTPAKKDQLKNRMKNEKYPLARKESRNRFDVLASSGDDDENEQTKDDIIQNNHSGIDTGDPNDMDRMLTYSIFDIETFVFQKNKHRRKKIESVERDFGDQKKNIPHENITFHSNQGKTTKLTKLRKNKKQEPIQNTAHHKGKKVKRTISSTPLVESKKQNKNKKQRPIESEGKYSGGKAWSTLFEKGHEMSQSQSRKMNSDCRIYAQGKTSYADATKPITTSSKEHVTTYYLYKYRDSDFELYDGPLIRDEQVPIFREKEEFKCSQYPTKVPSTREESYLFEIPLEKPDHLDVHDNDINQTTIVRPIKKRKNRKLIFIPISEYENEDTFVPHDINNLISNKKVKKKNKTKKKQKTNTETPICGQKDWSVFESKEYERTNDWWSPIRNNTNNTPMTQWDQESIFNRPTVASEGLLNDEQYNLQKQHVTHQSWKHSSTDFFPNFIKKGEAQVNQDELVCSRGDSNYTDRNQRTVRNERIIGLSNNVYRPDIIQNYLFQHNLLDSRESYTVVTETYSFNKSPLEKSADYSTMTTNQTTSACNTIKRIETICGDEFEDADTINKHELQFRHHPMNFENTTNEDMKYHSTTYIGQKETSRVIMYEDGNLAMVASRGETIVSPNRDLNKYSKRTMNSSMNEYDEGSYCSENETHCNDSDHSIPERPSILTGWLDSVSIMYIAAIGTYLIWMIHSLKKH